MFKIMKNARHVAQKQVWKWPVKETISKILEDAEDHPSVEAVYALRAKALDSSISIATVYLGLWVC